MFYQSLLDIDPEAFYPFIERDRGRLSFRVTVLKVNRVQTEKEAWGKVQSFKEDLDQFYREEFYEKTKHKLPKTTYKSRPKLRGD